MSAAKWVLMAWIVLSAMLAVGRIGQPVKPSTPSIVLVTLILLGAMAWMVVLA